MLLNMPAYNGTLTPSDQLAQDSQHHCANALKRKHIDELEQNLVDNLNHNDTELDAGGSELPLDNLEKSNNWKKRHILQTQNCEDIYASGNAHRDNDANHNRNANANISVITSHNETTETSGSANGMYNIISSSGFIGDFLNYEPAPISTQNNLNAELLLACEEPMFSTPTASTACIQSTEAIDNDTDDWQAGDLLELDHRYNSSLQTEITQLNPTFKLKSTELADIQNSQNTNANLNDQQQPQHAAHDNFLIPITQTENSQQNQRTNPGWTNYRNRHNSAVSTHNDSEADFEDKNLSWLLNFKFDEFPHLSPDLSKSSKQQLATNENPDNCLTNENNAAMYGLTSAATIYDNVSPPFAKKSMAMPMFTASNSGTSHTREHSNESSKQSSKTSRKFEELVMEVTTESTADEMPVNENNNNAIDESMHQTIPRKPPFTYTELIEYALEDKGELTVSGIYQWISDRFPYYKSNDDRWKNSVRHNLSINPHFRKGIKAPQGAGHLWTISSGDSAENVLAWEHKKQRLDLFFKMEAMNREQRLQQQRSKYTENYQEQRSQKQRQRHSRHFNGSAEQQIYRDGYDEAAVAAAIIQDEMLHHSNGEPMSSDALASSYQLSSQTADMDSDTHAYNDLMNDDDLRKTAGQILNGIHRDVEVQPVDNASIITSYQDVLLDNEDYMNPIEKSVAAVSKSSLRNTMSSAIVISVDTTKVTSPKNPTSSTTNAAYYVTEIDTMDLGLHVTSQSQCGASGVENLVTEDAGTALFNDDFNMNYFGYSAANANDAIS